MLARSKMSKIGRNLDRFKKKIGNKTIRFTDRFNKDAEIQLVSKCTPVIPATGRWRQEAHEFIVSLSNARSMCPM